VGEILTATGKVPGARGMETRRRLLEEVERRCIHEHYRELTVTEIARAADTSAATFYHYFPDIVSAVAEVSSNHLNEFDSVLDRARAVAESGGEFMACRDLADSFVAFWENRRGLLDVIDVASADEDPRLFALLYRALRALTDTLAIGVQEGHPVGVAGALVMMLSHTTARKDAFARSAVGRADLVESMALVLHATYLRVSAIDGDRT
jgi:AcrR family transcriptional regulator